jgi:hypothetical protein
MAHIFIESNTKIRIVPVSFICLSTLIESSIIVAEVGET